MNPFSSSLFRVASLAIALPLLGVCSNYTLNVTGSTIPYGSSTSGDPATTVTLADGDMYSLSPLYSTTTSGGTHVDFKPTATYESSTPLTAGFDAITMTYTQTITAASNLSFDGTYTETVPLFAGDHETASGHLTVGTTDFPTIALSGPGSFTGTASEDIENLPSGSVTETWTFLFQFFNGAVKGESASSPTSTVPEPAQIIPAGLSLVGFALVALRRRKQ